jgi:hypothetical protein
MENKQVALDARPACLLATSQLPAHLDNRHGHQRQGN